MTKPGKDAKTAVGTLEKSDNNQTQKIKPIVINQDQLDEIQKKPSFRSRLLISPRTGRPFFYFRYHGENLQGFLGHSYDCSYFNRGKSFDIQTDDGTIEEFFAGRYLQRIFEKYELEGKYIIITYIGDEYTGYGHARKVYKVEKRAVTDRFTVHTQTELTRKQKEAHDRKK